MNELDSYTEVSPSGTGLHVLLEGSVPSGGHRKNGVEMYDGGRFFTMTGRHVEGTPQTVEERRDAVRSVHEEYIVDEDEDDENSSQPYGCSARVPPSLYATVVNGK